MKDIIVAKRYALSVLYNISENNLAAFIDEVKYIKAILDQNTDLYNLLKSKIVSIHDKLEFFETIVNDLEHKEIWLSFFLVLMPKQRGDILQQILDEIIKNAYLSKNAKAVKLILAYDHDEDTILKIAKSIEKQIGYKIIYQVSIDKSIIGGFIAKSEDFCIDASVLGNLNKFVNQSITDKV